MRETITTCGELAGAALISIGAWGFNDSLGKITAGVALIAISWLASQ